MKEVWTAEISSDVQAKGTVGAPGLAATLTVDTAISSSLGGNGDLVCANTAGKYRANQPAEGFGRSSQPDRRRAEDLGWGFTGSPLVTKRGSITGLRSGDQRHTRGRFDKKETAKRSGRRAELTEQAAYTSPMPATIRGVQQYVILTNQGLAGVAAKDGKLLLEAPPATRPGGRRSTPRSSRAKRSLTPPSRRETATANS